MPAGRCGTRMREMAAAAEISQKHCTRNAFRSIGRPAGPPGNGRVAKCRALNEAMLPAVRDLDRNGEAAKTRVGGAQQLPDSRHLPPPPARGFVTRHAA